MESLNHLTDSDILYTSLLFLNAIHAHDSFIFPATCSDIPTYCGSRTTHCTLTCMLIRDFKMQRRLCTQCNELLLINRQPETSRVMQHNFFLARSFFSASNERRASMFDERSEYAVVLRNSILFDCMNVWFDYFYFLLITIYRIKRGRNIFFSICGFLNT